MYIDALEKFSQIDFETDLKVELDNFDINLNDYDIFEHVLDKHAPKKSKLIRGNEKPHMTGELRRPSRDAQIFGISFRKLNALLISMLVKHNGT